MNNLPELIKFEQHPRAFVSGWDPFRELSDIQNRLNSLLTRTNEESHGLGGNPELSLSGGNRVPAVDITEDEIEYTITADFPQVSREDVEVNIDDDVLTIKGERRREEKPRNETDARRKFHRTEREVGLYLRSFRLPDDVDRDAIRAAFEDETLTVHLPKGEMERPRSRVVTVD